MKILITGGAGFVGANLAGCFKQFYDGCEVTVFDNLKRRGSELNLPGFKKHGIRFVHGDVRAESDLRELNGDFDLIVDASAEASVHSGAKDAADLVFQTNLAGVFNCLQFAKQRADFFLLLSTSRVYSIAPLRGISLVETATRFEAAETGQAPAVTSEGVSEDFPTTTARSFYGATKLASELLLQEFAADCNLKAVIYRCGVIAGPGQFGRPDQGVFTFWLVNHYFRRSLEYTGFGGTGKQVRDLIHPHDLAELICEHFPRLGEHKGQAFNVGGGRSHSVSLLELTDLCRRLTGNTIAIGSSPETARVDVPFLIIDSRRIRTALDWKPSRNLETIFQDTLQWVKTNESSLRSLFS